MLAVCRSLAACQRKGVCWQYAHCMYKGMQNTRAYTRAQNTRACRIREHIQGHAEYKGMQNTRAYTQACRLQGHIHRHAEYKSIYKGMQNTRAHTRACKRVYKRVCRISACCGSHAWLATHCVVFTRQVLA